MKKVYLLPMSLLLAGALAGCHQGMNASTTIQDETGNGIVMFAGDLRVASTTVIADAEGVGIGSVSAVVANALGAEPDELLAIRVDGEEAVLEPAEPVDIAPGRSVAVSTTGDVTAAVPLNEPPGVFVDVEFVFASSGIASDRVIIVPPVGYYESAAPGIAEADEEAAEEEAADEEAADEEAAEEEAAEEEAAEEEAAEEEAAAE